MADEADKVVDTAEQAYAAAAEAVPVKALTAEAKAPEAPAPQAASAKPKPVTAKPIVVKKSAPKAKAPLTKAKPIAAKPAKAAPKPIKSVQPKQISQAKEPIMAKQADYTKTVTDTVAEFQTRAKAAYDKGAALAGEATEFTKGNIEAFVESSKILTENLQDLGKVYADEAKAAFETFTADLKELAAVKSPTELFQLQSRLARRNFDSLVAFGSKSSEATVKLTNEAIAPLSSRVSLAAEKFSKAA
jgi:phasin family protein